MTVIHGKVGRDEKDPMVPCVTALFVEFFFFSHRIVLRATEAAAVSKETGNSASCCHTSCLTKTADKCCFCLRCSAFSWLLMSNNLCFRGKVVLL